MAESAEHLFTKYISVFDYTREILKGTFMLLSSSAHFTSQIYHNIMVLNIIYSLLLNKN